MTIKTPAQIATEIRNSGATIPSDEAEMLRLMERAIEADREQRLATERNEAYDDGYDDGFEKGYDDGYADGHV